MDRKIHFGRRSEGSRAIPGCGGDRRAPSRQDLFGKNLFPNAQYVTFDIPQTAESARLDFAAFLRSHPDPLIIDEVQYVPEVLRHLKSVVDRDRRPGRFILTGF